MEYHYKISPIFYQGCKKKAIKKGLIDLFPKNIDTFYDMFGGSGIVSMNVQANKYVLNDLDKNLFDLYNMFRNNTSTAIIEHIEKRIEEFDLATIRTKRNKFFDLDVIERYKSSYYKFRDFYNGNKNALDLYTLTIFTFSQQMRFNGKTNDFNMPCGNDCFSDKNREYIKQGCEFFSQDNVSFYNQDYNTILFSVIIELKDNNKFMYFDPPYNASVGATYNENGGWTIESEIALYGALAELDRKGVKWGMSNSFSLKGKENKMLIDWCKQNNWQVHHLDVSYSAMGKGNSNNDEVFICNYD